MPYLPRIRTWSPHPIHRTSSASPLSPFPPKAACCLFHYTVVRLIPGQPASRGSGTVVGRSVDVGRLDLRGRMAAFPAQAQLGRGPPAASLAIYGRFLPTPVPHNPHLVLALPCPALTPAAIFQNRSHGRPNTDTEMELLVFLPTATALHCHGMSCP